MDPEVKKSACTDPVAAADLLTALDVAGIRINHRTVTLEK